MIEHVYRKLARRLPVFSEISIPLHAFAQTAVMSVFAVTARWSSVLVGALVAAAAWGEVPVPTEALMVLVPAVWADRTAVAYLRIRRR